MKTYLRYEQADKFGVISTPKCNIVSDKTGKLVYSSGVQDVLLWNVHRGELQHTFTAGTDRPCEVTFLCLTKDEKHIAAGYSDGLIRIWNVETKDLRVKFNGHTKAVSCLAFNADGSKMVSGSKDTDIIVWDTIADIGLFKLRGHNDQITDVRFLESSNELVSSSKDTLMKLWDLDTQHCVHTIVGHRSAIWSFDVSADETCIWTGTGDNMLRCVRRVPDAEREQEVKDVAGKPSVVKSALVPASGGVAVTDDNKNDLKVVAPKLAGEPWRVLGDIPRQSNDRVSTVRFSPNGKFVGVQAAGKVLEIFRVRSDSEVERRMQRRLRRQKEKKTGKDTSSKGKPKLEASDLLEQVCLIRTNQRITSFCYGACSSSSTNDHEYNVSLVLGLNNNYVEVYNVTSSPDDDEEEGTEQGAVTKRKRAVENVELRRTHTLELPGHRTDVRAIAISSDDTLALTASNGAVKLWNVNTKQNIRTMKCGYALCCAFVPGNLHAIVGTKTGNLLCFNLASGEVLADIAAHEGALWSLDIRPDGRGFVTGGADKQVRFWDFELEEQEEMGGGSSDDDNDDGESDSSDGGESDSSDDEETGSSSNDEKASNDDDDDDSLSGAETVPEEPTPKKTKRNNEIKRKAELQIVLARTLKMSEDVLCVRYSHHRGSGKLLLAVSLLDCTVKVFFDDSLKFLLSLYGHKLPVLSMDISSDNTLIATASADKNVKIWGLDFGDCHKSFFAHDGSVMGVRFVPRTHYFFTVSKDQRLRYWDADKFEMIQSMELHVGEVWGLATSSDGAFVLTCGHDKSMRLWRRTDEPLFLEEERENELERMFEQKLNEGSDPRKTGSGAIPAIQAEQQANGGAAVESAMAGKRSAETVQASEKLMEAVELADNEVKVMREYEENYSKALADLSKKERAAREKAVAAGKKVDDLVAKPQSNVFLLGKSPLAYVTFTLNRVPAHEREEALLCLPFNYASRLLPYLVQMIKLGWHTEMATAAALYLVRIHFKQIVATRTLKDTLVELQKVCRPKLEELKDVIGTNIAGLRVLRLQTDARNSVTFG